MSFGVMRRVVQKVPLQSVTRIMSYSGDSGDSGAIKNAGGTFAKRGEAQEAQYFRKLQNEQLKSLKVHVDDQIKHHQEEIARHEKSIAELKKKSQVIEKEAGGSS